MQRSMSGSSYSRSSFASPVHEPERIIRFFNNKVELQPDEQGRVKDPNERFIHWRRRPVPRTRPMLAWRPPLQPQARRSTFPPTMPQFVSRTTHSASSATRVGRPSTDERWQQLLLKPPPVDDPNWFDDFAVSLARFRAVKLAEVDGKRAHVGKIP